MTTVEQENNFQGGNNKNGVYSIRVRAGKRRTYFFDVRTTRANDYFLTITESKRRFDEDGYERHKIFLYKEDFNKFKDALDEATNYVKTELLPDYDFDQFDHNGEYKEVTAEDEDAVSEETSEEAVAVEASADSADPVAEDAPAADDHVEKW